MTEPARYEIIHALDAPQTYTRPRSEAKAKVGEFTLATFVLVFVTAASIIAALEYQIAWLWAGGVAGVAGLGMMWYRMEEHDALNYEERQLRPQAQPQQPKREQVFVKPAIINNGTRQSVIHQPKPGAFARWLTAVIDDVSRVKFSRNRAAAYGFTDSMYDRMVPQLRTVGWLDANAKFNGAPMMTDYGVKAAAEWLRMREVL